MKRAYILILAAVILCGCKKNTSVLVDYQTVRLSPLMYKFVNYSHGCDSYKWDFGDGTWSYATDYALHEFENTGKYTVTLIGTSDGDRYEHRQVVNVTVPDCYISGFAIYSIPYQNRYYKLLFKDDSLFPSEWDFCTAYTPILTDSDLPYIKEWKTPVQVFPNEHKYYTVELIRTTNASNTNNDVSCMKGKIKASDILRYKPEIFMETESGASRIGITMEYDY